MAAVLSSSPGLFAVSTVNSKTLAGNEYTQFRILIYYISCALYNVLALFECLKFEGRKDSFIAFPLFGKGFVNGKTNHL